MQVINKNRTYMTRKAQTSLTVKLQKKKKKSCDELFDIVACESSCMLVLPM